MVTAEKLRRMRKQDQMLYRKQVDIKLPLLPPIAKEEDATPFLPHLRHNPPVLVESHEDKLNRELQELEARYDQQGTNASEQVRYITGCKTAYQQAMAGVLEDYKTQDVPHARLVHKVWTRYQQLFDAMHDQVNAMQHAHRDDTEKLVEDLTNMRFNYLQAVENLEGAVTENAAQCLQHSKELKAVEDTHKKELQKREERIAELQEQLDRAHAARQTLQNTLRQSKLEYEEQAAAMQDASETSIAAAERCRGVLRGAHELIIKQMVYAKHKRLPSEANTLRPDPAVADIENAPLPEVPPFAELVEAETQVEEEEMDAASPRQLQRQKSAKRSALDLRHLKKAGKKGSSKKSNKDEDSDGDTLSVSSKTSKSASKRRKKSSLGEMSTMPKASKRTGKRDRLKSDAALSGPSDTQGSQAAHTSSHGSRGDVTSEL